MRTMIVLSILLAGSYASAQEQPPESVPYKMEIPAGLRSWYRNPDG